MEECCLSLLSRSLGRYQNRRPLSDLHQLVLTELLALPPRQLLPRPHQKHPKQKQRPNYHQEPKQQPQQLVSSCPYQPSQEQLMNLPLLAPPKRVQ